MSWPDAIVTAVSILGMAGIVVAALVLGRDD